MGSVEGKFEAKVEGVGVKGMVGTADGKSEANGIGLGEGATAVESTLRKVDAILVGTSFEPLDVADSGDRDGDYIYPEKQSECDGRKARRKATNQVVSYRRSRRRRGYEGRKLGWRKGRRLSMDERRRKSWHFRTLAVINRFSSLVGGSIRSSRDIFKVDNPNHYLRITGVDSLVLCTRKDKEGDWVENLCRHCSFVWTNIPNIQIVSR